MKDHEFVSWMADRMVHVYGESPNVDFVHRARAVADAIESQAATIARYETTAENCDVLRAKVDEQAREIERLEAGVSQRDAALDRVNALWRKRCGRLARELAALKAQPSGVVLPEQLITTDQVQAMLLEVGLHGDVDYSHAQDIWNACADRFSRLNSSPVSAGGVDERAAFEDWYAARSFEGMAGNNRFERSGGEYWYIGTRKSWDAWQARAALTASAPNHSEQVRDEWASGFKLHEIHKALDSGLPIPNYWAETCDGEPHVHTKLWRGLPGSANFHSSRFWPLYGVAEFAAAPSAGSQKGGE